MEELAKLLKRHQLASQSEPAEERQKSIPLTPEEVISSHNTFT
jgi:hypothetical protein